MYIFKYLMLLVLIPNIGLGQVKYVEKGEKAPYNGYLFTIDAEQDNRKKLIKYQFMLKEIELYKQNEKVLYQQVDLWKAQSKDLSSELVKNEQNSFWQNTLYFALGAIVTTGLAFGVSRAVR